MPQAYFITGTDTGIGKTWTTVALLRQLQAQGKTAVGMKPVASGCSLVDGAWRNEDALLLQQHASLACPYDWINPYALPLPLAPHIAAQRAGVTIDFAEIGAAFRQLQTQVNVVLVEGVGGWLVPLNARQNLADLAKYLDLPVIVVVGMRLGCLNHALLTEQAVLAAGAQCHGWIANCIDPDMAALPENLECLQTLLKTPLLGVLPYGCGKPNNGAGEIIL